MQVVFGYQFIKSAQKLPGSIQEKLDNLVELLSENPYHQQLHTKHLSGELAGFLSFRITRDWRVIFQFLDQDTLQLLKVGHRKDIYN